MKKKKKPESISEKGASRIETSLLISIFTFVSMKQWHLYFSHNIGWLTLPRKNVWFSFEHKIKGGKKQGFFDDRKRLCVIKNKL